MNTLPKRNICGINIITDPDDKTVFGCVYSLGHTYKLYAFKSEEVSETKEVLC